MRKPQLLSQVLAVNALLVVAAAVGAAAAARTADPRQAAVLACVVLVSLLANGVILRRRFAPLERLARTTEQIDLAQPGRRAAPAADDPREVVRLTDAFNRMLARLEVERRAAGRAVLEAQEAERRRLARDLHDEVNQSLAAVLLHLEAGDTPGARDLAGRAMDELLHLARELRPSALDDHGLAAALDRQVRDYAARTGIEATLTGAAGLPELTPEEEIAVYRITQESLSNAARHAHAARVEVRLDGTRLTVADDGCGFDPAAAERRGGGLGLAGMRERALLAGGRLDVRSRTGGPAPGTTVELTLRCAS